MSAFVVDDRTINRAVAYLAKQKGIVARALGAAGYNLSFDEHRERLARDMFDLNVNSIEQRYGDGEAKGFRNLDFKYKAAQVSAVQGLKSLNCWSYQACEGDIPETSVLFKALDGIAEILDTDEITKSRSYDEADWG